jgi:predicted Zn-dependent peptidase
LFTNIDCYHFGSVEPGLLTIDGKLVRGVSAEQAEAAVQNEIQLMMNEKISDHELQKVKNKTESVITFEDMSLMNRANSLAFYELLGDAQMMNTELGRYHQVTASDILNYANEIFREENSHTLYYLSKQVS